MFVLFYTYKHSYQVRSPIHVCKLSVIKLTLIEDMGLQRVPSRYVWCIHSYLVIGINRVVNKSKIMFFAWQIKARLECWRPLVVLTFCVILMEYGQTKKLNLCMIPILDSTVRLWLRPVWSLGPTTSTSPGSQPFWRRCSSSIIRSAKRTLSLSYWKKLGVLLSFPDRLV